ncbi:hypothetical protein HG536_0E05430 [Torulaspora globosa]|uniref:Signal recognition particle subunit SRP72 n=1 Tax=Torulaspora globosa TaxID=48254 RepID=A0A7G3ZJE6_9SACH|nr:uncharacterized protein HG536_0E05430 [Torulaspora globosa]QLL33632.1 hypothetical protein HG536_0E05430 [Torulaspora globosa]
MANESLTQLLSQLNVQSTKDEFAKVEQTCMNVLNNGSSSVDLGAVLKAYLVASIKQDKYDQGFRILSEKKEIAERYGDQIALEKLYIYYKLNETRKFEELYSELVPQSIDAIADKSEIETLSIRGFLHVRAQFCYKNGLYDETQKIYHYLASHNSRGTDNDLELQCNERVPLAANASLALDTDISTVSEESYDLLYNNSMILSARGEYEQAIELLKRAGEMAVKDGYESDINAIELQLSFVYQMVGNTKQSKELLDKLISKLDKNSPIALLANMNKKAFINFSKYKTNLNLVLRELNPEALNGINKQHFTQEQWSAINRNLLFLHLFNSDSIQSKSSLLSRTLHNYRKIVNNMNFESYESQAKKLYHQALKMIESGPNGSVIGFLLLTIQLQVIEKQWDNAIRLGERFLNRLWERRPTPEIQSSSDRENIQAICYILLELYKITGRNNSKTILLNHLMKDFSLLNLSAQASSEISFWKHIAFEHLEQTDLKNAKSLFEKVSKCCSDRLINKILSDEDLDAEEGAQITQGVDVEAVIAAGVKPLEPTKASNNVANLFMVKKVRADRVRDRKKRERLARFIKHHGIKGTLDPERWLPKKDRTSYRPKKRQLAKQTQGGAVSKKAEQALDISKKTAKSSKKAKNRKK